MKTDTHNIAFDLEGLKNVFQHISNGVTITDAKEKIVYVNSAFSKITGYHSKDVMNQNPGLLHSGKHGQAFYQQMWDSITQNGSWQGEVWNRRKNGTIYPELLTITKTPTLNQDEFYYIAVFNDISFIAKDKDEQYNLAFYDPLTLLPNRQLLFDRFIQMKKEAQRARRSDPNDQLAVIFIDLDKFKPINDTYGHVVGDQLLQYVAKSMCHAARKVDTIARYGGDEFAILLPKISHQQEILDYCHRIQKKLTEPFKINGNVITVAASIGIALYPKEADDFETLIDYADKAMYHAKKNQLGTCFHHTLK